MDRNARILVTGAAGFIGSCMAAGLNRKGYHQLILCDDFSREDKGKNHEHLISIEKTDRSGLKENLDRLAIQFVIHMGARTDTTEMNYAVHKELNLDYSKMLWEYCSIHKIPLIYASSAATYGDGTMGYSDDHSSIAGLQPLNPYGVSKNEFDKWALLQAESGHHPPHWYGLKFFNVYGPNEYHKGRMASVILHAYRQIRETGRMKLFRSHDPRYKDGEQKRDFIYVTDIMKIVFFLMECTAPDGIYNAGTGTASSFLQLAHAVFHALNLPPQIEFIDTPEDIRATYQYFTEADMDKLLKSWKGQGFEGFTGIEQGVNDYVKNYLLETSYFLP